MQLLPVQEGAVSGGMQLQEAGVRAHQQAAVLIARCLAVASIC